MGADIHMIAESRGLEGRWELSPCNPSHYSPTGGPVMADEVELERNYALFSTLAGVRSCHEYPCLYEPRGVPEDMGKSAQAWWDRWNDGDYHTPSWLYWDEAMRCAEAASPQLGHWLRYAREPWGSDQDHRIIFAFDN
jgi:hypothetical protein